MNMLVSGLPKAIKIGQKTYEINSDYKTCLRIVFAMEDKELTQQEKSVILLKNLYKEIPDDLQEGIEKGIKFLDCGQLPQINEYEKAQTRYYSLKKDDRYIYSAVDRVLNGRLSKGDFVHWWEFVMVFMELPEDCMMSKILYFRTQYSKGKLSKEEQRVYNENRELFELHEELTDEEEDAKNNFMSLLGK